MPQTRANEGKGCPRLGPEFHYFGVFHTQGGDSDHYLALARFLSEHDTCATNEVKVWQERSPFKIHVLKF